MSTNPPDLFQAGDNLKAAAQEAAAWIAHLNVLAASLEGRIRFYHGAISSGRITLDQLEAGMKRDLDVVNDLRNAGPVIPKP